LFKSKRLPRRSTVSRVAEGVLPEDIVAITLNWDSMDAAASLASEVVERNSAIAAALLRRWDIEVNCAKSGRGKVV